MAEIDNNIKNKIVGGLAWVFGQRILAQLVSVLVTILLARFLDPEHYGTISIVTVFITFMNIFVTSGFGSALVQKQDADETDFNTAFLLSFGVGVILYAVLFFLAPVIANSYENPLLDPILKVLGLQLPLAAINNVQSAYIQKKMIFQKLLIPMVGSTLISGAIGIIMAYIGFGVWALVAQYLSNVVFSTVFLLAVCPWRPGLCFSRKKAIEIYSFGWKVLATQLVSTLENDIRSLIVGKVFGPSDLAYYDQGRKFPSLLVMNISSSIDSVMLSAYSKEQDDKERLLAMLRRSIRVGLFVLTPLLLGFAAISETFIKVLLTEKWLPAVPFMQVFCIAFFTRPLESSCRQALLSIGKSGTLLISTILINATALIGIMVGVFVFKSVFAIALVSLLNTLVSLICYMSFSRYYIKYSFKKQLSDIFPPLLLSIVMYIVVVIIGRLQMNSLLLMVLQVVVGAIVYIICSAICKLDAFQYILDTLKIFKRHN